MDFAQNTLYLTTPGTYVAQDHLTLQVRVPLPPESAPRNHNGQTSPNTTTTPDVSLKSEISNLASLDTNKIDQPQTSDQFQTSNFKSISIPIHHLESICAFGAVTISPPALALCWEHGVAVNFLSENGYLLARLTGVPDSSVTLRRAQFRAADDHAKCAAIARHIVAGKLQNCRNSLLRAARESEISNLKSEIAAATDALARLIHELGRLHIPNLKAEISNPQSESHPAMHAIAGSLQTLDQSQAPNLKSQISNLKSDPAKPSDAFACQSHVPDSAQITNPQSQISNLKSPPGTPADFSRPAHITHSSPGYHLTVMDTLRGIEGMGTAIYFSAFNGLLKQQRDAFAFTTRSRRPPRDRINCLLSFLYALVRHDCIAALTSIGLDPFVGFLHVQRPNRPALALDLMEEFRPWLADRLAVTLINRQQISPDDFVEREGGTVEFTDAGRKRVITAYQQRKQDKLTHPLLDQEFRIAQIPFVQARILARHLRNDIPNYVPFVPK